MQRGIPKVVNSWQRKANGNKSNLAFQTKHSCEPNMLRNFHLKINIWLRRDGLDLRFPWFLCLRTRDPRPPRHTCPRAAGPTPRAQRHTHQTCRHLRPQRHTHQTRRPPNGPTTSQQSQRSPRPTHAQPQPLRQNRPRRPGGTITAMRPSLIQNATHPPKAGLRIYTHTQNRAQDTKHNPRTDAPRNPDNHKFPAEAIKKERIPEN